MMCDRPICHCIHNVRIDRSPKNQILMQKSVKLQSFHKFDHRFNCISSDWIDAVWAIQLPIYNVDDISLAKLLLQHYYGLVYAI